MERRTFIKQAGIGGISITVGFPAVLSGTKRPLTFRERYPDLVWEEHDFAGRYAFAKIYWQSCHEWLLRHNCELNILCAPTIPLVTIAHSTSQFEMCIGAMPYFEGFDKQHGGIQACAILQGGEPERLFDEEWYPNRGKITRASGYPIKWSYKDKYSSRGVYISELGPCYRNVEEWEDQFAWYAANAVAIKRALMGDTPFEEYCWNLVPDDQKAASLEARNLLLENQRTGHLHISR